MPSTGCVSTAVVKTGTVSSAIACYPSKILPVLSIQLCRCRNDMSRNDAPFHLKPVTSRLSRVLMSSQYSSYPSNVSEQVRDEERAAYRCQRTGRDCGEHGQKRVSALTDQAFPGPHVPPLSSSTGGKARSRGFESRGDHFLTIFQMVFRSAAKVAFDVQALPRHIHRI